MEFLIYPYKYFDLSRINFVFEDERQVVGVLAVTVTGLTFGQAVLYTEQETV